MKQLLPVILATLIMPYEFISPNPKHASRAGVVTINKIASIEECEKLKQKMLNVDTLMMKQWPECVETEK